MAARPLPRAGVALLAACLAGCSAHSGEDAAVRGTAPDDSAASGHVVTLAWSPPTTREDGTPLKDLAGYRIYYGPQVGDYRLRITVDDPRARSYRVEYLPRGTYAFVITAVDADGRESRRSEPAQKTVP